MRRFAALLAGATVLVSVTVVFLAAPARPAPAGASLVQPVRVAPDAGPHRMSAVEYGPDGGPLLMDVYLPARSAVPAPVVLVLHGGGWAGGSRTDTAPEAEALSGAGMAVLNLDYRLATPAAPAYQAQLSDLDLAIAWARAHAASLDIDPTRLGVLGLSAGGTLALDLAARGLASAVVAWSAPTDLAAFETPGHTCTTPSCGPISLSWAVYQELGCLPSACSALYADASPASVARSQPSGLRTGPNGRGVRLSLWTSVTELVPRSQTGAMAAAAQTAGAADIEVHVLPGSLHAGQYAPTALAPTVAFLASSLAA